MPRLRTRWNQKDRTRNFAATGSALAANTWKLAAEGLLNLENAGFETQTNSQRLDAISEFLAYSIHLIDRLSYRRLDEKQREQLINAIAARSREIVCDNRRDSGQRDDDGREFVDLVNRRGNEYAKCSFDAEEGPGFTMRRMLGGYIQDVMGEKDNKWIPDYVLDAEAPEIFKGLKRATRSLLQS